MKHQVVLLGTPWNIDEVLRSIGMLPNVQIVQPEEIEKTYPLFCLYFGQTESDAMVSKKYEHLLAISVSKRIVQPVVLEPEDCKNKIPNKLKGINVFFLGYNDPSSMIRLKNLVATFFGLINANKKVFISYRRTELELLAQKLYMELIKRKYNPFLDSFSIEEGVDFQEHLHHELIDSDIIILLDSPNFNSSEYCMEEFNIANQERIPVLDIRFNIDQKKNNHRFCDFYETGMNCDDANKDNSLVECIVEKMECNRFRAYHIKRQFVLDAFNVNCSRYGITPVEQGGFLRCDTTHECFIPLTHIPTTKDLFDTYIMFKSVPLFSTYSKQILYNGSYCRPDVQSHLSWLDANLPIKTFNIIQ